MNRAAMIRLLPWADEDGQPCYLSADEGVGFMWQLADNTEALQLSMAADVIHHAHEVLDAKRVSQEELRYLAGCLMDALANTFRIADSRGQRLGWSVGGTVFGGEKGGGSTPPADASD
ncbi:MULTISPECIES: hypothetical protein [Streptomyces]|uniref:Uncharacterized protein n=1 Tax=Streptomyces ramulosus TaxID=47762 RepID=A0ABW1FNC4_9ACTN